MADCRRYPTGSAPTYAPQGFYSHEYIPMGYPSINTPQANSIRTSNPVSLDNGVVPNDSSFHEQVLLPFGSKFSNSEFVGTTDQLHAGFTNNYLPGPYQLQDPFVGPGFPNPGLVGTAAPLKGENPDYTVQHFQQPHPYIQTEEAVAGSAAKPLIHQNPGYMGNLEQDSQDPYPHIKTEDAVARSATGALMPQNCGYMGNPEEGEYNIGCRIPSSGTSRKRRGLPDIPDLHDPSLEKEIKLKSGSNSPKILSRVPVFPNIPPAPCRRSQKNAELPRKILKNPRTRGLNKRHANIQSFNAEEFYDDLPKPPPAWTHNGFEFRYNKYGELENSIRLSGDEMVDFLYYHPLHKKTGRRERGLVLWVQTVPADSGTRYPNQKSDKCRFAECPVKQNTIHKGFFRVAIDENHHSGIRADPYHCAGFVHLYCLEKFLDFPSLCKEINVQPDNRLLAEPKNRMAITRDHDELFEVAHDFINSSEKRPQGYWEYKSTLSSLLTEKHLELEPGSRARKREKVGGNHLGRHRGDLEEFVRGETKKYGPKKRTRDEWNDEDSPSHHQGDREASVDDQRGKPQAKKPRKDRSLDEGN